MSKLYVLCIASVLLAGVCAGAENSDRDPVAVPLHDPSRPAKIHVHLMMGGVSVRGEDRRDISVMETNGHGKDEAHAERPDGMHRLDLGGAGLDIREENNEVTIKTDLMSGHGGDLVVLVPRRSSVELKSMNGGEIGVENVEGEIEVENLNGPIRLKDVAGSVVAHSLNGEVVADLKRVDASKPMSFSTMNGKIDVTLPADIRANVSMKTDNGEILSDFEVKLDSAPRVAESGGGRQSDGTYHIHLDKTLHGTINGGGPEYKFRSFNGQILIRKRK